MKILIFSTIFIIFNFIHAHAQNFGAHKLWDDGLAEVAVYSAKNLTYGKLWEHEIVLITVKEDFNKAYYTKADYPHKGKDLLPVLKLNFFTKIQTKNYPYHYLVSVFVKKDNITYPVKMTVSSQEWCGNTFKEWINGEKKAGEARMVYHSYWDEQGDGSVTLEYKPGNMLTEQLFLSLRSLPFKNGHTKNFRLLEPQMSNKFKKPAWLDAQLQVSGPETLAIPEEEVTCWNVLVRTGSTTMNYWFNTEYPHVLIKYTDSSGQEMILKKLSRRTYWH